MSSGPAPMMLIDAGRVPYAAAHHWQKQLHARLVAREGPEVLLLVEHPHVYTLGRRFRREHLLTDPAVLAGNGVELFEADRGGSITYHGPGQLVAYPIVDLRPAGGGLPDPIGHLRRLEAAIIDAAASLGVAAGTRQGLTGVWVRNAKLACIGVNVSRGVSKHGLALNVSTDLSYFDGMVPCGIDGCAMTSLSRLLGRRVTLAEAAGPLAAALGDRLGRRLLSAGPEDAGLDLPLAVGA